MINKKFMLIAVLIVSLLAVSAVSANDLNTTDEVIGEEIAIEDNLEITQDDALSTTHTVSGNTFEDIQNVINLANEGDTISLSGLYDGNGNNVKISKELTIEGNGAILDAHRKSEIFEICGKNVVVNNVTFINGYNACGGAIDWWPGIYDDASNYNGLLTNSRFINCRADLYGGAVYFFSNGLTMKNCYFEGNFAKSGGAVYVAGNFSAIENCTFFNNFYLNPDLDGVSVPDGLALLVDLEENDVFTKYKTDIKDCKYLNDASAVKYLLSPYSENEGSGDGNYIVPKYKLSGNVVSGNTFADIQKAIDNARPGDVVELSGTYKGNGTPIEIHRGITVVGVGQTTLDADGLSSIFSIASVGVSLFNLKLTNGYSSQNDFLNYKFGGAINSFKKYLYIGNTIFENNNGYIISTIHSVGDYTVLNNCTFRNNGVGMTKNTAITLFGYDDCGNSKDGQYTYQSTSIARLGGKNSVMDNCVFNNNLAYKDSSIKEAQLDEGVVKLSVPSFVKNYGDSKQLEITLTEDGKPISNGKVSIQIGHDITKTVYTDSNGKASVDLNGLSLGTYMIVSNYNNLLKVSVVVVEEYVPSVDIKTSDVVGYYGGTQKVVAVLTKDNKILSNVDVKISANGKTSTVKTDSKGQASVDLHLPVGTHEVTIESSGVKATSIVTVKSTITVSDATGTYSNSKATATFLDTAGKALASRQVTFKIGDKSYPATTNSNGVATADIPLGVGTYVVTAVNPVNNEQKQFRLTISKANSTVALTTSQNDYGVTLTAALAPATATGKVTFYVVPIIEYDGGVTEFLPDGHKTYEANVNNGKATVPVPDLDAGSYAVFATYWGDSNVQSHETDSINFKVAEIYAIITANDVSKVQGGPEKLTISLKDSKGNAIINSNVDVALNGVTKALKTDSKGQASMAIDLPAGSYNATITFDGAGKYPATSKIAGVTVKKSVPILTADSITAVYGIAKNFVVNLRSSDGSPIVNQKISLKIYVDRYTYYLHSEQSDANGQLKLSSNELKPGTYTVYINSEGCKQIAAKITIKKATPKMTAKAKTFKKSVKTKKYTITLKTNLNKVMKNTKVTIKVNKKTYTAKTKGNGKATFKITKLNKKGKYTATITYKGSSCYNKLTKKVKITVK